MPVELLAALAVFTALAAALGLSYHRARRRLRTELSTFCRIHGEALSGVADGGDWREEQDDGWRALVAEHHGLALRLAAVGDLRRSTFIEYTTRLTITAPAGRAFALPGGTPLTLELAEGGEAVGKALALAQLPARRLAALATELFLEPDRLVFVARPSEPTVRRYSYGIRLQLDPAALGQLVEVGRELAGELLAQQA